jgi:hypothetical protein
MFGHQDHSTGVCTQNVNSTIGFFSFLEFLKQVAIIGYQFLLRKTLIRELERFNITRGHTSVHKL